jgi:hypothetical protein
MASIAPHIDDPSIHRDETSEAEVSQGTRLDYLSQVAMASHLDYQAFKEVAEDARFALAGALFVSAAGLARAGVAFPELGGAGYVASVATALITWAMISTTLFAAGRWGIANRAASLPELMRGLSIAAFPMFGLLLAVYAGTSVPYLAGSITWGLYALAVFNIVVATREILAISLPKAYAVCVPAVLLCGAIVSLIESFVRG